MSHHIEAARIIACKRPFVKRGAVEVDPDGAVAAVPNGIWVSAWVFVDRKEINAMVGEDDYWTALKRDLDACPIEAPPSPEAAAAHYLVTGSIKK